MDSIIVGRFVGDNALAAVGSAGPILNLMLVRPMWISIATSVAIRVPLAYLLVGMTRTAQLPQGNCAMMYVSMLISWSIGALITLLVYRRGKWKDRTKLVTGNS